MKRLGPPAALRSTVRSATSRRRRRRRRRGRRRPLRTPPCARLAPLRAGAPSACSRSDPRAYDDDERSSARPPRMRCDARRRTVTLPRTSSRKRPSCWPATVVVTRQRRGCVCHCPAPAAVACRPGLFARIDEFRNSVGDPTPRFQCCVANNRREAAQGVKKPERAERLARAGEAWLVEEARFPPFQTGAAIS